MPGNRDQQSRRGGRNDSTAVRPSSRAGKGNRAAKTRSRGRRRPVDESGFGRQGGANQGKGVGTLGLELEGRDSAPRRGVGSLDLDLEGADESTGSLGLDLE
jgi:hypothetical protein